MTRKTILLIAFALMIMAQLYVPGKMIWDNERVWVKGINHRFITAPVDPVDVFRGKYIDLYILENMVPVADKKAWENGQEVFGLLNVDSAGFTFVSSLLKEQPKPGVNYLKLTINYVPDYGENEVQISFPFQRFYMEESKAYQAELSYNASARDTTSVTYALVSILDGKFVLKDVLIDGVPIKEVAEKAQEQTNP
ncbi:MAG: GDYXXLXY domain-containing protein [Cytophagales bacterium]|nr:GDYXXLXY domain-containing protein [Cytophagales bacterium]